jgi:tetratricopeptide (TPR) repeat protein
MVERADTGTGRPHTICLAYSLSLFLFVLGLMCKPMLVTLPFIMLLLDFWPLNRFHGKGWKSTAGIFAEKLPFFVAAFALSIVTLVVQSHSGAVISSLSLPDRIANALVSYCRYAGKLFWPSDLAVFYPYRAHWPQGLVASALGLLLAITVAAFIWRRKVPWLFVGWFWFLGTLVPVIGLVQAGEQSMADRYSYLPTLGLLLMVVWGLSHALRAISWRAPAVILAAAAVLACMWLTREQIGFWKDSETLFLHAIAVTRGNYMAHNSLGTALGQQGRLDEAVDQFQEALREKPGYFFAHANLGTTFHKQGKLPEAVRELQEAIRESPSYSAAHCKLGSVFESLAELGKARAQFEEALREKPGYAEARVNLGIILSKQGHPAEAILQFQQALRDNPRNAQAHYAWGAVLDRQGEPTNAIEHYRASVALNDANADAHYNLGSVLARTGLLDEAIQELRRAIELRPESEAYNNLGVMLERKGLMDEAIGCYTKAVQLKPGDARAHYNRGLALCKTGGIDAGIAEFNEALRLKPGYSDAQRGLDLALRVRNSLQKNESKP